MTPEETAPQGSESPEQKPPSEAADFREYVKWRKSGDPPVAATPQPEPPASEPPPAAEPAPEPGPEHPPAEQPEKEEDDEPGKGRGGSRQRKIEKLARENEQLRAQLAAAASQPKPPAEPPPNPIPDPSEPKLENFDSLEAWQKAWNRWDRTKIDEERETERQKLEQRKAAEKIQAEWDSRQRAARKAHPDYDDLISSVPAPEGPGVADALQAIQEDEAGAEVLYWLAQHPDEIARIAALPPRAAVREVGRLSAILSPPSGEPANGNRITAAPKPPPGATRPAKPMTRSIFDPNIPFPEYVRLRKAQMKDR
jgi:hypothetical protein